MVDLLGKYRYSKVYKSVTQAVTPDNIYSDKFFLRNAEAYLNKAEASAMLDNSADANTAINTLRRARYTTAGFQAVNLSGQTLINLIRDERRREMCFEGQRLFDLKRYAVNAKIHLPKV